MGAGIVGVEYATIFRAIGVRVTVIDGRERPLDFLDHEIEDALYYLMRDEGITLRFGERVSAVRPAPDGRVEVGLVSGKTFATEAVMFSAGRQGNSDDLNLAAIGIQPDERGRIPVGEAYQTPVEPVYAAGDDIGFPSLASTSMEQGASPPCGRSASPAPASRPDSRSGSTRSRRSPWWARPSRS